MYTPIAYDVQNCGGGGCGGDDGVGGADGTDGDYLAHVVAYLLQM